MSNVISDGQGREVIIRLVNAGLTPELADEIIGSRGNKKAKAMMAGLDVRKAPATQKKGTLQNPFEFLMEFDVVVPNGFRHETCLGGFAKDHRKEFYYFNPAVTDANFAKATTNLTPGRKFKVKAFGVRKEASSEQCIEKVHQEKGVLVGAQGLTLAYLQGKGKLPKGKYYLSFDEKEALPYLDGSHRVPYVGAHSDGAFRFSLHYWGCSWDAIVCLLVFCDSQ